MNMQNQNQALPPRKGPVIGQYANRPIHEYLVYGPDIVMWFSHVAPQGLDGGISLGDLKDDECVVSPGLVYREGNQPNRVRMTD